MILLALDQGSTRNGWCRGPVDGPTTCGSFGLKPCGGQYGAALHEYRRLLIPLLDGVDVLAFEQPVRPFADLHLHTARLLYGIAGIIEYVAVEQSDIDCFEADNQQVKKLVWGKGGKKPKPVDAIRMARGWGFDPANGDEADACGVFLYTVQQRFPDAMHHWIERRAA
jgi:hypothetical protein